MKYRDNFRKEYFAKIKEDGYELNGQMFVQMEKDLYIEWLETKLQNTASNSDYAKCQHKTISWADGKWFCEDCKRPVVVKAHFA
jgi:hypothetical protein